MEINEEEMNEIGQNIKIKYLNGKMILIVDMNKNTQTYSDYGALYMAKTDGSVQLGDKMRLTMYVTKAVARCRLGRPTNKHVARKF